MNKEEFIKILKDYEESLKNFRIPFRRRNI
jgi:hypothetical protein